MMNVGCSPNPSVMVGGPGRLCCLHEDREGLLSSELPVSVGLFSECYTRVNTELNLGILRRESNEPITRLENRLGRGAVEGIGLFCLKKERLEREAITPPSNPKGCQEEGAGACSESP